MARLALSAAFQRGGGQKKKQGFFPHHSFNSVLVIGTGGVYDRCGANTFHFHVLYSSCLEVVQCKSSVSD